MTRCKIFINMKKVYLCTPFKLGQLNQELINRIEGCGFEVLCAVTHTPQNVSKKDIFAQNVKLIKEADIFIAVLKDYGKDLAVEVGMAYAWNKPRFGIDYTALESDVMCFYGLEKIVKPEELKKTLEEYR